MDKHPQVQVTTPMLRGWKSMAQYAGVHVQTIREWHYYKLNIPFFKSAPGKGGKISIPKELFHIYLRRLFTIGVMGYRSPNFHLAEK